MPKKTQWTDIIPGQDPILIIEDMTDIYCAYIVTYNQHMAWRLHGHPNVCFEKLQVIWIWPVMPTIAPSWSSCFSSSSLTSSCRPLCKSNWAHHGQPLCCETSRCQCQRCRNISCVDTRRYSCCHRLKVSKDCTVLQGRPNNPQPLLKLPCDMCAPGAWNICTELAR